MPIPTLRFSCYELGPLLATSEHDLHYEEPVSLAWRVNVYRVQRDSMRNRSHSSSGGRNTRYNAGPAPGSAQNAAALPGSKHPRRFISSLIGPYIARQKGHEEALEARSDQDSGWLLIRTRGGGGGDSTSVECLFSMTPLPGSAPASRRKRHKPTQTVPSTSWRSR